jgi:DNA-binding Lrp family transcriptional regulator
VSCHSGAGTGPGKIAGIPVRKSSATHAFDHVAGKHRGCPRVRQQIDIDIPAAQQKHVLSRFSNGLFTFLPRGHVNMECFSVSGDRDYVLQIVSPDMESYNTFLNNMILHHLSVQSASSSFALRRVKYTTALPIRHAN